MKAIAHSSSMLGNTRFGDQWRARLKARWCPAQKAPITAKLMKNARKLGMRLASAARWSRTLAWQRQLGRADLDNQQRDGDREHRVGKEDQPLERVCGRGGRVAHSTGSTLTSNWPSLTCAPGFADSSVTMPSNGAVSACSIFIASSVSKRCPLATFSPLKPPPQSPAPASAPRSRRRGRRATCRCRAAQRELVIVGLRGK